MPKKKSIIEAWKLTPRNPSFNERPEPFWIVRYDDETGNMVNHDGQRLFRETTRFEHEPSDYINDDSAFEILEVPAASVPAQL